ncbi:MAG: hypothetical protein WC799_13525 [Desulfobacteraceae bacterium]|jgi:hypothetical protein
MVKKTFNTAIVFFLFCFTASDPSSALNLSGPGRPMIAVNGATKPELTMDIVSVSYDNSLNRLEVTLKNWDTSTPSYKYSESNQFIPGVQISLFMGPESQQVKLFDGILSTCTPHFNQYEPSTLTFVATGSAQPAKTNLIQMSYGADLLQFDPTITSKNDTIQCTGQTDGNPDIQTGTSIFVTGVGQRYSRTYRVTKTLHTFDSSKGYKTQFTATTGTAPETPDLLIQRKRSSY